MARRLSLHPRISRFQRSSAPVSPHMHQAQDSNAPAPREPQVVDRRGRISALIEATPQGYEIFWRLATGAQAKDIERRGPYPTRALAICWARVGLLLREEAWLAVHIQKG